MTLLRTIAVRVGGLLAFDLAYTVWLDRWNVIDDPVGAGLAGFLLIAVIAFGWAARDGARRSLRGVAVIWAAAAAAHAVLSMLVLSVVVGSAPTDSVGTVPLLTALVLTPALAGGGAGLLLESLLRRGAAH